MPQFFLPPSALSHRPVIIRGADARHIADVLRLQVGDWLLLCDGEGRRYEAVIEAIRPLKVQCTIRREVPLPRLTLDITLAAAVIRPERYEWLIEKAFELGCRRLVPLVTERSVKKYLPKDPVAKLERWRAIALSAAKQSGLPWTPQVTEILALAEILNDAQGHLYYCWEGLALAKGSPQRGAGGARWRRPPVEAGSTERCGSLFRACWEPAEGGGRGFPPPEVCEPRRGAPSPGPATLLLIGPEGGFTSTEHDAIMAYRPTLLPLGPLILRTETAALTAITLIQRQFGYFS
ncbi:MAG: 16S rRNA (uracil(1498)-N(3))-methyltransferase [Deltaproteobacteria bacterium]|nr:16S rRNA (uracil(1498)-N(3))-methyltransferase [Deltaproteobacteria bacterium]